MRRLSRILLLLALFLGAGRLAVARADNTKGQGQNPARVIRIQVFPGQGGDLVDPGVEGSIPVALLSDVTFDARDVETESLSFAGSSLVKMGNGTLSRLEDVNHDGRQDLVVAFSQQRLQLGRGASRVMLAGRLQSGEAIVGHAVLRPMEAVRLSARSRAFPAPSRKAAPRSIAVDILPGDPHNAIDRNIPPALPVAILSNIDFDATSVDPGTIQLGGSPVTRNDAGRTSEVRDVNGDGLADLVVQVQGAPLRLEPGANAPSLSGRTRKGELVIGQDRVQFSPVTKITYRSPGIAKRGPVELDFASTGSVTINDNAAATPYPSNILIAGAAGVISEINVTLIGLTHSFEQDVDILLVGPTGQSLVLMSDAGGGNPGVSGVNLTFDDDADAPIPQGPNPVSGRYQVSSYFDGFTDVWPAQSPSPSGAVSLAAFNGTNPNGVWSLYIVDDAGTDVGTLAGWSITIVTAVKFSSNATISIPDNGIATPYPSTINVSGLGNQVISKATVTLHGFTHTFPDDVGVLLVGPRGDSVTLMHRVGGVGPGVSSAELTFDDHVPAALTTSTPAVSGTYRPSQDFPTFGGFTVPAPPTPYGAGLGNLTGTSPEGAWSLYVQDFAPGDSGSISGWDLTLTVMPPEQRSNPATIVIPASGTQGAANPYPSDIIVGDVPGDIGKTTVTLYGLSHTFPDDLDVFLQKDGGQCAILMSDAGAGNPGVSGINLTFDDDGAILPDNGTPPSGTYHPADYNPGGDLDTAMVLQCPYGLYTSLGEAFAHDPAASAGTSTPLTWSLYVYDDEGGDVGSIAGGWSITFETYLRTRWYCNNEYPSTIYIPAQPNTSGPANFYPSNVTVSGVERATGKVQVGLGLSHTSPADLDLLLVHNGVAAVVMSDVGTLGSSDTLFDPSVDEFLPQFPPGPSTWGPFRPTDYNEGVDTFPAPAPAPGQSLNDLAQMDPNGIWSLYAVDDTPGNTGSMDLWCLRFTLLNGVPEIENLRWSSSSQVVWNTAPEAQAYRIDRGVRSDLPSLLDANVDSCRRDQIAAPSTSLSEVPVVGSFYWYIVRGLGNETLSPGGFARVGSTSTARVMNDSGDCPP